MQASKIRKSFLKDWIIPRVSLLVSPLMKIFFFPLNILNFFSLKGERKGGSSIIIEAGSIGWLSIEFKELYCTACEYLGSEKVSKLVIQKDKKYFLQLKNAVNEYKPTHYFYDPRTGSQHWFRGIIESIQIAILFSLKGIIPVVLLTDFSYRTWRIQAIIVTVWKGVVISFLAPKEGSPLFPHDRIVAPSLMPLSIATLNELDSIKQSAPKKIDNKKALFVGSLYEPRTTFLNTVAEILRNKKLTLEIRGRIPGEARKTDFEYWNTLCHSPIIVTTAEQIELAINDWKWISQLTYRYLETMACGTLLIAPEVPGIRRYFIPGIHFVSFHSAEEAANKIEYYLRNRKEREKISAKARFHARSLIESKIYWLSIDMVLGKDSIT